MSNLRNAHVPLSILEVKGHIDGLQDLYVSGINENKLVWSILNIQDLCRPLWSIMSTLAMQHYGMGLDTISAPGSSKTFPHALLF